MDRTLKYQVKKPFIFSSIFILTIMNLPAQNNSEIIDNSRKTILARACDPAASINFAKIIPPLIGNAIYVPTTDDADFIKQLESRKWSVVFFAPGACRLSAAKRQIPGGNYDTRRWTLDQYKALVRKLQGDEVQIVETLDERETVKLLNAALEEARERQTNF